MQNFIDLFDRKQLAKDLREGQYWEYRSGRTEAGDMFGKTADNIDPP